MKIPRFLIANDAFSAMGRLMILYFAVGAGVVFGQESFCSLQNSINVTNNITTTGCGTQFNFRAGESAKTSIRQVGTNQTIPVNVSGQGNVFDQAASAIFGFVQLVWGFLQVSAAVIGWPGTVLAVIPGFPVLLGEVLKYSLSMMFAIAGLMWLRGVT